MSEEIPTPAPAPLPPKPERFCSFCLKSEHHVAILVSGPKVFICDECVHLCSVICGRAFLDKSKRAEDEAAYVEAGRKLLQPDPTEIELLNPDMPAEELRLHMGELSPDEVRVARAAIAWANTRIEGQQP
jgi:hypothetical protein